MQVGCVNLAEVGGVWRDLSRSAWIWRDSPRSHWIRQARKPTNQQTRPLVVFWVSGFNTARFDVSTPLVVFWVLGFHITRRFLSFHTVPGFKFRVQHRLWTFGLPQRTSAEFLTFNTTAGLLSTQHNTQQHNSLGLSGLSYYIHFPSISAFFEVSC